MNIFPRGQQENVKALETEMMSTRMEQVQDDNQRGEP